MTLKICLAVLLASGRPLAFAKGDLTAGQNSYATCILCHGQNGEGSEVEKGPKLAGQFEWYIYDQLVAFKNGTRKNVRMNPYLEKLNDNDFKNLAAYISSIKLTSSETKGNMPKPTN